MPLLCVTKVPTMILGHVTVMFAMIRSFRLAVGEAPKQVIYCRYTDQEAKAGARLWARYACGLEAPLDVQPDESAAAQG